MKPLYCLCFALSLAPFSAYAIDQHSEEYRLLKSWGLKFNADGALKFQDKPETNAYQPWQPDIRQIQIIQSADSHSPVINPLVISSKPEPQSQSQP